MTDTFRMHAHRAHPGAAEFWHIYPSPVSVRMCGSADVIAVEVRIRRDDEPETPYWGWLKTGQSQPSMIWPSYVQLCLCFQAEAGLKDAVARGDGVPVNLVVTEARPATDQKG